MAIQLMSTMEFSFPFILPPPLPSSSSSKNNNNIYQLNSSHIPSLFHNVHAAPIHVSLNSNLNSIANADLNELPPLPHISQSLPKNQINTLCKEGRLKEALRILCDMQQQGFSVDSSNYASLLKACSTFKSLPEGKEVHAHMLMNGLEHHEILGTKLVGMYAKCGSMLDARLVFDKLLNQNVKTWDALIRGYASNGSLEEALNMFYQMQQAGIQASNFTFPFLLKACAGLSALPEGKEIHGQIVKVGFESDVYVVTALIDMYVKCGRTEIARKVFDKMSKRNVVSWNAMLAGYVQNGHTKEAFTLFDLMQLADVKPSPVTILSLLQACSHLAALHQGKWVHAYIIRNGLEVDDNLGSALIDMYAKCRSSEIARRSFDKITRKNIVSWTAMIAGYAQNGRFNEALTLFHQMQLAGIKPNSITMVSVLPACGYLATLQQGKWIHAYIIRSGFEADISAGNSLVAMYSKCGHMEDARCVFDKMYDRDVASWNALITGYGMHGHDKDALALFFQMQQTGLKPNHITFVCVLAACSHAGLVDEGWQYFDCMNRDYSIIPGMEHYACMVDLLGRAGRLDEAYNFIKKMPFKPGATVWGALLGACRIHCNVNLGERATKHLLKLEPENAGNYVLLGDIYAAAGKWDRVAKVRKALKDRGLRSKRGCSWIEIKNKVHAFLVGDIMHPQSEKIYAKLDCLAEKMEEQGHVTDMSLHDVDEEKEYFLCNHSEKLAIAFGLINASPGTPVRITKNLRMCDNCHSAAKLISKIVRQEIIVRDVNRFHHFNDGHCACRDYW
eukprot:Gb_23127 [translate_table: standard]